jgi:hypothetical protein
LRTLCLPGYFVSFSLTPVRLKSSSTWQSGPEFGKDAWSLAAKRPTQGGLIAFLVFPASDQAENVNRIPYVLKIHQTPVEKLDILAYPKSRFRTDENITMLCGGRYPCRKISYRSGGGKSHSGP